MYYLESYYKQHYYLVVCLKEKQYRETFRLGQTWEIAHNCGLPTQMGREVPEAVRMKKCDGSGWAHSQGPGAGAVPLWIWVGGEGRAWHSSPASVSNWLEDLYPLGLNFSSTKW